MLARSSQALVRRRAVPLAAIDSRLCAGAEEATSPASPSMRRSQYSSSSRDGLGRARARRRGALPAVEAIAALCEGRGAWTPSVCAIADAGLLSGITSGCADSKASRQSMMTQLSLTRVFPQVDPRRTRGQPVPRARRVDHRGPTDRQSQIRTDSLPVAAEFLLAGDLPRAFGSRSRP